MKFKRFMSLMASIVLAITSFITAMTVSAETITGKCGDNATWSLDRSTGIITISGTGEMYTDYTSVNQWGYYPYRNEIKEVVVEEGITSISKYAFGPFDYSLYEEPSAYPNLTKLILSSTVKSIGAYAFYKAGIETISFSECLETIGNAAFSYTSLSGDLILPLTLNSVGHHAFYYTNITFVDLHERIDLGGKSFANCNLLKEVIIPKDLDFLATPASNAMRQNAAFFRCESLERVIIEGGGLVGAYDKIENGIGDILFGRCTSLKEIIIDSEDIEYVGANGSDGATFDMTNNPTFYIYKGSTTEKTLREAGYLKEDNTVYIANFSTLEKSITEAEGIDTSLYTEESVFALNEALDNGRAVLESALENIVEANQEEIDEAVKAIKEAIKALEEKKEPTEPSEPSSDNSSDNPTEPTSPTNTEPTTSPTNTPNVTTKPNNRVAQAKADAQKKMNQAKITKLKVKSKSKKKITVSWKKVNKAVGYEVQVSKNNKFKNALVDKFTKNRKITIKNKIKRGKTYFVRVRAYATYKNENGKARKVYSKWIKKVRKVRVK